MIKIGLVFSGGGARGIAHIGLLHGLEELGIRPTIISGVSSGALVGALYSAGHSPKQILELLKTHSSSSFIKMLLSPYGLFSANGLKKLLNSAIPVNDFGHLQIPLFVTATDITNSSAITFSSGHLYEALIGSSAVPGIFKPVKFDRRYLADGGVLNNLPVECVKNMCDKVIGCNVNKLTNYKHEMWSRLHVVDKCFHLAIAHNVTSNALKCDLFLEPLLAKYMMLETKYADEIFKIGYRTIMEKKELLLSWSDSDK